MTNARPVSNCDTSCIEGKYINKDNRRYAKKDNNEQRMKIIQ